MRSVLHRNRYFGFVNANDIEIKDEDIKKIQNNNIIENTIKNSIENTIENTDNNNESVNLSQAFENQKEVKCCL